MKPSSHLKTLIIVVIAFFLLVAIANTIGVIKVEGNEAVVRQHLSRGVVDEVWRDGTHFFFGWFWDTYKYDIGTQKVTFDDRKANREAEYSRIVVNVGEGGGQEARIALSVNYRIGHNITEKGAIFSPERLVRLHTDGIGKTYENVVLKRTIQDVVNEVARPKQALEIYSGAGFVKFKEELDKKLKAHKQFRDRGILIENTIVYKVYLDPAYEKEIAQKQIAVQQRLRKIEETKAAEEEAKRVFALSQADVEKRTQAAEAKKIEQVKAAEAEKIEQVLRAEGERDSNLAKASGILAVGKAEAEVAALKREALYAGPSGAWRAKVEIATKKAEIYRGMLEGATVLPDKTIARLGETSGVTNTGTMIPVD